MTGLLPFLFLLPILLLCRLIRDLCWTIQESRDVREVLVHILLLNKIKNVNLEASPIEWCQSKSKMSRDTNRIREWPGLGSISTTKMWTSTAKRDAIILCQNVFFFHFLHLCPGHPDVPTNCFFSAFRDYRITSAAPPSTKGWHLTYGYLPKLTLLPPFKRPLLVVSNIVMIMVSYDDQCHLSCWIHHLFIMTLTDDIMIKIIILLLFFPDIVSRYIVSEQVVVFWRQF